MSIFNDRLLELLEVESTIDQLTLMASFAEDVDKELEALEDWGVFVKALAWKKRKTKNKEQVKIMQRELVAMTCKSYQSVYNLGIVTFIMRLGSVEFAEKSRGIVKFYCSLKHTNVYSDVLTEQAKYYPIVGDPCYCGKKTPA